MARVLMKSLRSAAQIEHVIVEQFDMTIAEIMDPESWPLGKSFRPLEINSLVTIFASDGAAQCYVASHDLHGRPELAFFRMTVPAIPNSRRSRQAELVE